MDKQTRFEKIRGVINASQGELGKQEIVWQDELESMSFYKIPLKYLVYNKYNGRILTRTKSLESQGKSIDVETKEGKELIEKLLWESKIDRNKQTQKDLERFGQKKVGIVTADGIIIDGNRRAMLLGKTGKYDYFKAIVLPVTLDENPIEIEKLETSFQMGEDEKLSYNPIEKYLKAQNLKRKNVKTKDIAEWMGETESEINNYISTMDIMDDYLDFYGYNGMYTQLYDREDQFLSLTKWMQTFYDTSSAKGFDGYKNSDVDDLKTIAYDYIRANYEGKSFRIIADGLKENHFFGNKEIWQDFRDKHFRNIDPIRRDEEPINLDSPDLEKALNSRDAAFRDATLALLKDNLDEHTQRIGNQKNVNEPEKLISRAIDATIVASTNKNIAKEDVLDKVEQLNDITVSIMRRKSPISLLKYITKLLTSLKGTDCEGNKTDIENELKNIQHEAYRIGKDM